MFEEIYHDYLLHKNKLNVEERYEGNEGWYHASGAGLCSRKLYYESVEKLKMPPKNFKELGSKKRAGMRKMGLGTIIHENIQSSLLLYNNIYNNNILDKKENKENNKKETKEKEFIVEGEITIPSLNVRGFYDVLLIDASLPEFKDNPLVKLYDIKTMNGFKWARHFPRGVRTPVNEAENYRLQLATYGIAIKEEYGNLDYMAFIYYNINTQTMRESSIPLDYLDKARRYWYSVNEEHSKGIPEFRLGTSPSESWVCNYCDFKGHCKPPIF